MTTEKSAFDRKCAVGAKLNNEASTRSVKEVTFVTESKAIDNNTTLKIPPL